MTITRLASNKVAPYSLSTIGWDVMSASSGGDVNIRASWPAMPNAAGYVMQVEGFAPVDVGNVLTYTYSGGLTAGVNYNVAVRGYDSTGAFSGSCSPKTVTGISGDLQFITSSSGTATSAINVTGCFSSIYDHYLIMRSLSSSVAANNIAIRLRSGTTDDSAGNYRRQRLYGLGASVSGDRGTGETLWYYSLGFSETTSIGFSYLWVSNPYAVTRTTMFGCHGYDHTASIMCQSVVGEHDVVASYDGFSVIATAGTLTGTVYVYGLRA